MQKSFSMRGTSRQDLAKRSGQHAQDCEYWITSVFSGRPLKDLFHYYFSLWNIITFLRDYWTIHNENDCFQRIDTMDKQKQDFLSPVEHRRCFEGGQQRFEVMRNQIGPAAAVTRGADDSLKTAFWRLAQNEHSSLVGRTRRETVTAKVHAERNAELLKRSLRNPASAQRSRRSLIASLLRSSPRGP